MNVLTGGVGVVLGILAFAYLFELARSAMRRHR